MNLQDRWDGGWRRAVLSGRRGRRRAHDPALQFPVVDATEGELLDRRERDFGEQRVVVSPKAAPRTMSGDTVLT
jgi:hypothetical protein